MNETHDHNENCSSDTHHQHLCFLMHEGFHYQQPQQYKALVQNAQCRCQQCGRTAQQDTNLCMPVSL